MIKFLLAIFTLMLAAASQASVFGAFIGKYENIGRCSIRGVERAYIGAPDVKQGLPVLEISLYGKRSTKILMSLGQEKKENPNYKLGNPIQWIDFNGFFSKGDLVNTVHYIYKNGLRKPVSREILSQSETGVVYRQIEDGKVTDYCVLNR